MKRKITEEISSETEMPLKRRKIIHPDTFDLFDISKDLKVGLRNNGFISPTEIQKEVIPKVIQDPPQDLIIQSKNGTGKTIIFTIGALQRVDPKVYTPQILILVPTREICVQVHSVVSKISNGMNLTCKYFIGGMDELSDVKRVKHAHIVVGTPGRTGKLFRMKALNVKKMKMLVLDEADVLFSDILLSQTLFVLKNCRSQKIEYQTLSFSATFERYILQNLQRYMDEPEIINNAVERRDFAVNSIQEYFVNVDSVTEEDTENEIKQFEVKKRAALNVLNTLQFHQAVVFCSTPPKCMNVCEFLKMNGFSSTSISGRMSQENRMKVMSMMSNFEFQILVCTSLMARGVDFYRVSVVLQMDLADDSNTYVHRIGRTARFNGVGLSINIVTKGEFSKMEYSRRLCKKEITVYDEKKIEPGSYMGKLKTKEEEVKYEQFVKQRMEFQENCGGEVKMNDSDYRKMKLKKRKRKRFRKKKKKAKKGRSKPKVIESRSEEKDLENAQVRVPEVFFNNLPQREMTEMERIMREKFMHFRNPIEDNIIGK